MKESKRKYERARTIIRMTVKHDVLKDKLGKVRQIKMENKDKEQSNATVLTAPSAFVIYSINCMNVRCRKGNSLVLTFPHALRFEKKEQKENIYSLS